MQHPLLSLALLCAAPAAAGAQTVFVTTVADQLDFGGAQTLADLPGPDGKVSMREAVVATNNTPGPQTIGFQVPAGQWGTGTTGPKLINAGLPFKIEDDATTVDGTTQTAFTGDTNPVGAEVSFHSTTVDVDLIQTGIIQVYSDDNRFLGLGDMTGRNYGIDIQPEGENNRVTGCVIKALFAAVRVQGDNNTVGGTAAGEGNRLDSLSDGLRIHGLGSSTAENNLVFGNFLTGDFNGVQIAGLATGNRIGGFGPGESNWIAGAGYLQEDGTPDGAQVRIEVDSIGNFIHGNRIGTNFAGTTAANDNVGDAGVEIYGDENDVRGNVIGGITGLAGFLSVQAGISLREGAERNVIQGNQIGCDATGLIPIPNRLGIRISAFDSTLPAPGDNVIGGLAPGQANTIAFSEEGGIHVLLDTLGNEISGNSIRDGLAGLGIDLGGDGPTPNDPGDADTGPNGLMNFPALGSAVAGAQGTVVVGQLDTPNPASARLEVFSNPAPGGGAVAQAETPLAAGKALPSGFFALALPGDATGLAITATATDALGNTSEISPHALAVPTPYVDLGQGLAGAHGVPKLQGGGTLVPGTKIAVVLTGALELAPGFFVLGTSAVSLPVFGGTLVPAPQVLLPFTTDAAGQAAVVVTWPSVPSGTQLFAQAGLLDLAALQSVAISNAVRGTTP